MRRGDVTIVSAAGDYGKPRPAVVVQSNLLTQAGLNSVIVCLLTSQVGAAPAFRVDVEPAAGNGLKTPSQIMVEKVVTVRASRIARVIGQLDEERLLRLDRALAFVLGLGG